MASAVTTANPKSPKSPIHPTTPTSATTTPTSPTTPTTPNAPSSSDPWSEAKCRACRQLFREPKLVPCGHLLCRDCLLTLLKTKEEARCPRCLADLVEPKERIFKSWEEITDMFPTDFSMEALLEARALLTSGNGDCCVCEGVSATALCLHCGDLLCAVCKVAHGKLKALKHHVVEDLTSLTPEKLAASRPAACPTHPEQTPKLFCPTHGESFCLMCAASPTHPHQACPDVEDIQEQMEEAQEILDEIAEALASGESDVSVSIDDLDQHLRETEARVKAALVQNEEMFQRLEAAARDNRRRVREKLVRVFTEVKDAVNSGKAVLLQRRSALTAHRRVVQRVRGMTDHETVQFMTPVLEERTHDLDYSAALPADAKAISAVTFFADSEEVSRLERSMWELGQITVRPSGILANELPVFRFHEHHGSNMVLTQEGRTAERSVESRSDNGIVLSSQPMHFNVLYEVRLDKWEGTYVSGSMCVGVLTQAPGKVTLPAWSGHLRAPAVVIRSNWIKDIIAGTQTSTSLGKRLSSLRVGSRVGLLLDSARCLHLYVDGEDQGIAARDVPRPCYALFDVCDDVKMVTALPVTRLSGQTQTTGPLPNLLAIPGPETTM